MCDHDHSADLSRRSLGTLLLAGAATSILPASANAAAAPAASTKGASCPPPIINLPALAVSCIDYRLPNNYVGFFNGAGGPGVNKYDLVSLAGATLAAGSGVFLKTVEAFYEQVGAAHQLHQIKKVVFVDHMGCGAYKVEFNRGCDFEPRDAERAHHIYVMRRVAADFPQRIARMGLPPIGLEFWLFSDPKYPPVTGPERIHV